MDSEYEKLKDNYDILKYCDYSEYFNSSSSDNYYEQVNELKQKLNEKDNLLKKQDEELKEKDRTIEQLERFKDDCKDKEIEKLKISNEQKDNEIERLKAELEELKKLSLKNKEIEKSDIEDKKIEELKKECRDLFKKNPSNDTLRSMASKCRDEGRLKLDKQPRKYLKKELEKILKEYSGYVEEEKK